MNISEMNSFLESQNTPESIIIDFQKFWGYIVAVLGIKTAEIWLTSSNGFLDGVTPLDYLHTGNLEKIREAFNAYEAGSYA